LEELNLVEKKSFETLCVHGYDTKYDRTGAISVPIYQSATFSHLGLGESTGFDYSRLQNPTREHVEKTVAQLEGGVDAIAFSSGMAAIATLMELFKPGDHIIASDDLYGGSHRLFQHVSQKNGISFSFVDTSDLERIEAAIQENTQGLFVETPTNPMMQVTDLRKVSEIAQRQGLLLVVDNTFLTPYFQKPLNLGADLVIHSGTKFLGGHNDTLAGFVVIKTQTLSDKLRFLSKTIGAGLAPFDSWLIIRGIKTLPLRMEQQQQSAHKIALWLTEQRDIRAVYYVGLPTHKDYAVSVSQSTGFGSMISFVVGDEAIAKKILERVRIIQFAESLGGVESLITYPITQTHADVPKDILAKKGITTCLLRLSVGIENVHDLLEDLRQALA
jgi:cystathionine gamma-synthase